MNLTWAGMQIFGQVYIPEQHLYLAIATTFYICVHKAEIFMSLKETVVDFIPFNAWHMHCCNFFNTSDFLGLYVLIFLAIYMND